MVVEYLPGDMQYRVHNLLFNAHMSQEHLARTIGITPSKLSRFLRRETSAIEPEYIIRIAQVFNVSTDFLLGVTNDQVPINYDIDDLRFSRTAIRKLVTGEVDIGVVNQLLEHEEAGEITHRIREHQDQQMRQALNAAARLSTQLLTSAEAEYDLEPEDKAKVVQMKQDAKNCITEREDVYFSFEKTKEMAADLFLDVLRDDVYCFSKEEMQDRKLLCDRTDIAERKLYAGFQRGHRIRTLLKLWMQISKVFEAPDIVKYHLRQAYIESYGTEGIDQP